jgi:hypothetical protein
VWWAATLVGRSVTDYEDDGRVVDQPRLFGDQASGPSALDRDALVRALRGLLAHSDGDQIPASAVRQLIAQLERGAGQDDIK